MAKTLTNKQAKRIQTIITVSIIALVVIVLMFPLFVMLVRSFMTEDEIYNFPKLLPSGLAFENYYDPTFFSSFLKAFLVLGISPAAPRWKCEQKKRKCLLLICEKTASLCVTNFSFQGQKFAKCF